MSKASKNKKAKKAADATNGLAPAQSATAVMAAPPATVPALGATASTAAPGPAEPAVKPRARPSPARQGLNALASLRFTVVLFALSLFLVFFGTLAQIEAGLWTVMRDYFRSFYVWVPFQLMVRFGQVFFGVPQNFTLGGSFPFPAGWTLGGLLLLNLIAAHTVRFKLTKARAGIYVLHAGMILMLVGELITGVYQVEASMTIAHGETVDFTDVRRRVELAITTPDPTTPGNDLVVVVPQNLLIKGGRIAHADLPFDLEVKSYWKNSAYTGAPDDAEEGPNVRRQLRPFTNVPSKFQIVEQGEGAGVDTESKEDVPSVTVAYLRKGTEEVLAEYLSSLWYYPNTALRQFDFSPQQVKLDGTTYTVELRPKREKKPAAIKLLEFTHERYPGTTKPKAFSSKIELETASGVRREAFIEMNNPMRYEGEAYFQQGYLPGDKGTVLQVVRNPAWQLPYISCAVVTLGLLVHFGISLWTFMQRRTV